MTTRHRLQLALILLTAVIVTGTAGFHYIEGWSWFDGFYMILTTMTTIGSGELRPLSHAARIFNSFMIVAAVLAGGFVIATFSQTLLEFEFGKAFGRRRMERELAKLSGHYIICGAGRVGRTVARQLRASGETCVVIDRDPNRARWAEEEKIPVIVGNASSEDILQKAHIDTARVRLGRQLGRRKSVHRAYRARIPSRPENHRARQRGRSNFEIIARRRLAGAFALQLHRASHRAASAASQRAGFRRCGVWA